MIVKRFKYLLLVFLLLKAFGFTVEAQNTFIQDHTQARQLLNERGEIYFSFVVHDAEVLKPASLKISLESYDPATSTAHAYANSRGFESFILLNLPYQLETPPGLKYEKSDFNMLSEIDINTIDFWDFYPTYEAYESMMEQFEQFEDLYEKIEILTLDSGRKLIFGRITKDVHQEHNRPRVMYTSTMHGDETTGFNLLLRLIHHLLFNYGTDPVVTYMLDNMEIWICPNENPDGTYRDNNNTITNATRGNINFIDLNRNYPNPVTVPEPVTQAETQAMIDLVQTYPFVLSANIHGGIECVNYPWDSWKSHERTHADHYWWQLVMHEYADTARFHSPPDYLDPWGPSFNNGVTHGGDWYVIYGSRQDYMNYYAHLREFTLEISNTKLLPTHLLPAHWEYNYRSLLNYLKQSLYGIRGTVTDINTGNPLMAKIELTSHDKDNSYVFSSFEHGFFNRPVLEGTYTMKVSAIGYPELTINNIQVQNYEATLIDVELGVLVTVPEWNLSPNKLVYPNPASSHITIMAPETAMQVTIADINGRIINTLNDLDGMGTVDVSYLAPGAYYLRVHTPQGVLTQKLMITR